MTTLTSAMSAERALYAQVRSRAQAVGDRVTLLEAVYDPEASAEGLQLARFAVGRLGPGEAVRRFPLTLGAIATEVGYTYEGVGTEFWPRYETMLQAKLEMADRRAVADAFRLLEQRLPLVEPVESAFNDVFSIIAWPLVHALMPRELAGAVARLLARAPTRALPRHGAAGDFGALRAWASAAEGRRLTDWLKLEGPTGRVLTALLDGNAAGRLTTPMFARLRDAFRADWASFTALEGARARAAAPARQAGVSAGRFSLRLDGARAVISVSWPTLPASLEAAARAEARAKAWRPRLWDRAPTHAHNALGAGPIALELGGFLPGPETPAYPDAAETFGPGSEIAAALASRQATWTRPLLFIAGDRDDAFEAAHAPLSGRAGRVFLVADKDRRWAALRRLDRDGALLGALGIASDPLPHQLDTVHRMLTGVGGRWLLADEVGLGKTVQALMLFRGLSAQAARPLRMSIVTPDDLFRQWEAELATRADALALEDAEAPVRLHTPGRFQSADAPRMRDADLLIIDEWPRLTSALRDAVRAAARVVPDVLVLSATPDLQDPAARRELMALLEPELDRLATATDADLLDLLQSRDARGAETLRDDDWGDRTELPPDVGRGGAAAAAFGAFRRVIRSRRKDYPGLMPTRRYAPLLVDQTDGDAIRAQAARDALTAARGLDVDVRNDLILELAGRSPQTLERGLNNVSRKSRELREALREPRGRIQGDRGDARLDALLDDLLALGRDAPGTRVVVVAQDTPTVDHLSNEIERMLDVAVTRMQRLPPAEDLEVQAAEQRLRLQPFVDGHAPVLVAADSAKEGHNLQSAERIYFYVLPWSPQDVEQWVGRIDRLGGPVGVRGAAGRIVDVTPIVVRGSLEHRILSVLEAAGVFEQSALYEGELWEALASAIEAAAYNADAADWRGVLDRAKASARRRDDDEALPTAFPPVSRASVATELYERLDARLYAGVVPTPEGANWFDARERGIERLLRRLQSFEQLDIWWKVKDVHDPTVRFSTVWYKGTPKPGDLIVPEIEVDGAGKRRAFLSRRDQLGRPPVGQVKQYVDGKPLKLEFLDHGGRLHDSLVSAYDLWPAHTRSEQHCVEFPAGHPALTFAGCDVLLDVGELKLAHTFVFDAEALAQGLEPGATQTERDAVDRAGARGLHAFEQDRRWLLDLCPPVQLRAAAAASAKGAAALQPEPWFEPMQGEAAPRWIKTVAVAPAVFSRLGALTRGGLASRTAELKEAAQAAVVKALPLRLFLVSAETDEAVEAARAELARAERRAQPRELAQAAMRAARLSLTLAERSRALRLERLRELPLKLRAADDKPVGSILLRPLHPQG